MDWRHFGTCVKRRHDSSLTDKITVPPDKTQRGREAKLMRKAQREFLFNDTTHKRYVSIFISVGHYTDRGDAISYGRDA